MSVDFLEMSDEDFLNAPLDSDAEEEEVLQEEEPLTEASEGVSDEDSEEEVVEEPEGEETSEEEPEEEESTEEVDSEEKTDNTSDLERVLQPFKANGTEVQVKNVDEAIQLMQMGANYTKKMQALQPHLKIVKMLEQQELLDEDKLNYLLDLNSKNPEAIAKLVKDSGIDPLDLESEEGSEYKPKNYSVSDEAMQLEQVLSDIENTPTYSKCIDVVGNQWDSSSKQLLSQNPQMIRQLNEQMQLGIFDQISAEMQRVRMFGGLSGLSDFEAYREVGTKLYQSGELKGVQQPVDKTSVQDKPQDKARSQKRKAASTPKSSGKAKPVKEEFNPLAMSDEEFEKIMQQQLR